MTDAATRTRNDHDAEQILGAAIDLNTYPIRRDSESAIGAISLGATLDERSPAVTAVE